MRKVLTVVILLLISLTAMAVPAYRTPWRARLTDGSVVNVCLMGDEYHSWLQTVDGFVVEKVSPGIYQRTARRAEDEREAALRSREAAARRAPRRMGSAETAPLPTFGSPRVPVILVNFTDSVFSVADTDEDIRNYYDLYCNGTRDGNPYRGHGSYGAIRDYFSDQSDGKFTPEFTIFGPVTVSHAESYYGQNNNSRYNLFVREAIDSVSRKFEVDWSLFDNKSNGQVDMVFLIFAGCGQNTTDNGTDIWPNERTIGTVPLENGESVTFACSGCCSERALFYKDVNGEYVSYAVMDGIGVMCHELSHALGLPDLYDTNYKAYGMDLWSLMDYGCYAGNSKVPCAYTAYERDFMGWRSLVTLTSWGQYTIDPISNGGIGYKIINEENANEYYILENRQKVNWDRSLGSMGHGLQVTHVDYQQGRWTSNSVNTDPKHQRMTVISANNLYHGSTEYQNDLCTMEEMKESWAGTLYPFVKDGVVMNDSLTAYSTPAATVFSSSGFMHQDLHAIRENGDQSVTFYFGNDYVDGINELSAPMAVSPCSVYDLSGRPVDSRATLRPGLYIREGRKYLVR